jgi:hypothetical protein
LAELEPSQTRPKTLSHVNCKKGNSHFWYGLMEVKRLLMERGRFKIESGHQTRFWEDLWIGDKPLMKKCQSLYNIVRKKKVMVAQVLSTTPLNVSFRRALVGQNWDNWLHLVGSILNININEHNDSFIWTANKNFITCATTHHCAWRAKIPLKIKILFLYLRKGVILTKDNLAKRKRKGCTCCCFCNK